MAADPPVGAYFMQYWHTHSVSRQFTADTLGPSGIKAWFDPYY